MATAKADLKYAIEDLSRVLGSISTKLDRNIVSQIVLSFLAYLYLLEPDVVKSVLEALKLMDIPPELFQIAAPSILIYLFMSWSYGSYQFIRVRKNLEDAYNEYFGHSKASRIVKDSLEQEMFIPHSAFKYLYQVNLSPSRFDRFILHLALIPLALAVSASTSLAIFYAAHYVTGRWGFIRFDFLVVIPIVIVYIAFYVQFYRKMKDFEWYQEWVMVLAIINVLAGGNLIMFLLTIT